MIIDPAIEGTPEEILDKVYIGALRLIMTMAAPERPIDEILSALRDPENMTPEPLNNEKLAHLIEVFRDGNMLVDEPPA